MIPQAIDRPRRIDRDMMSALGRTWTVHTEPDGVVVADTAWPPPDPAPVTTIGWRINHLIDNYGRRANHYFGTTVPDTVPGTAAAGLAQLELSYRTWIDTVSALDDDEIQAPLGPKGGEYAVDPMAALIVHVAREGIHHGAEICLLRDLYRAGTTELVSRGGPSSSGPGCAAPAGRSARAIRRPPAGWKAVRGRPAPTRHRPGRRPRIARVR